MKYCCECGAKVVEKIPEMDDRLRYVCEQCDTIHYQNPKVVVGTVPIWQDKILLCRRAIEPQYGLWTLPAGFMENGESTLEGARRETYEESGANFRASEASLYRLFDIPYINQVYLFYLAELDTPDFSAGIESLEVQFFTEDEIPWSELAFPVIHDTLKEYFEDRRNGNFIVRSGLPTFRPEYKALKKKPEQ